MVLHNVKTDEKHQAVIEKVVEEDFKHIKKNKARFDSFNWNKFKGQEVYKLRLADSQDILGLMCLIDYPPENGMKALEINLLEVSSENRGQGKKWSGIAGCLIAFACRESFKRGYEGWVFLIPKSELVEHYTKAYGFIHVPLTTTHRPAGFMELETASARALIKRYQV
ncbi:hypothetical protein GA0116948_102182 [Chitinophaga costaii]|uniref:N-acetyltransferase domain-containing protein n=1 Tax=Chitinophaga costaii TaxID=1335309 RepID=A0A1C4AKW2_9BACT|nr:hypothetical protein [Chitinophaga costaii]PUZ26649.1 hypothetical protein DCM91_09590 [Chitinophaga costaii]SCB95294.1 hypothetical protein GA0116948_102182 [Chitinophaga costaii]